MLWHQLMICRDCGREVYTQLMIPIRIPETYTCPPCQNESRWPDKLKDWIWSQRKVA